MKKIIAIVSIMCSLTVYSQTNLLYDIYHTNWPDVSYNISSMYNSDIFRNIGTYSTNIFYKYSNENISVSNIPAIKINETYYVFLFSKEQWNILTNFYGTSTNIESIVFYK